MPGCRARRLSGAVSADISSQMSKGFPMRRMDQRLNRVPGNAPDNMFEKNLVLRLQQELEEYRGYAANQVCDGVIHFLGTLQVELSRAQRCFPRDTPLLQRITVLQELIEPVSVTLQDMRNRFRPAVLDQQGLLAALEYQLCELRRRTGATVHSELWCQGIAFSERFELAVFRILEEALSNVERHSNADEVSLFYGLSEHRRMRLEILDNGTGIDPTTIQDPASVGLARMREQAVMIGGNIDIRPVDPAGTRVCLTISEADWAREATATGFMSREM
jgi:signal transduction histidine kinase